MAAPPYMKLWIADFVADTLHLNRAQVGSYQLLLMAMWRAGGKLPANDAKLAQIARCTAKEWAGDRETLLSLFKRKGGQISHKRLAEEMAKAGHVSGVRKQAAELAVAAKRKKNRGEAVALGEPSADHMGAYIRVREDNPPSPLAGGGALASRFDEGWAAYPLAGRGNRGPDKAREAWAGAAGRAGGEDRLLATVRAHAKRLTGEPRQTVKAFDRWLRDDGFAAYLDSVPAEMVQRRWDGPPDVWALVVGEKSEAFARSWLAGCGWQDVPRAILGGPGTIKRLREAVGPMLSDRGIQLQERAA